MDNYSIENTLKEDAKTFLNYISEKIQINRENIIKYLKRLLIFLFFIGVIILVIYFIQEKINPKTKNLPLEEKCKKFPHNILVKECRENSTNEILNKRLNPVNDELSKNSNLISKMITEVETIKGNVNNLYESTKENLIETKNQIKTKIENIKKVFGSIQSMFMHLFQAIQYTIYSAVYATNSIKGVFRLTDPIMKKFRKKKK
jgi:hypothetical protein